MADASDMKDALAFAQKIIDSGNFAVRVPYVNLAACVIFVWDYFLTPDLEVQHIWKSRWNVIKVVYLLQRYLPFLDSGYLGLYRQLAYHHSLSECHILPFANGLISIVGIALSEVLLGFCVYAVWARNKYIAMSLIVIGFALFGCMFGGMYIYADALEYFDFSTRTYYYVYLCLLSILNITFATNRT